MQNMKLRLFKAVVSHRGRTEEVPVWAENVDQAHDQAAFEYDEVHRVRPVVEDPK